uniref:Uncharacterized protein n=1 Tax=termite gut metagenome TaxID=433724 RepID=S0DFF9_9ZZZZ
MLYNFYPQKLGHTEKKRGIAMGKSPKNTGRKGLRGRLSAFAGVALAGFGFSAYLALSGLLGRRRAAAGQGEASGQNRFTALLRAGSMVAGILVAVLFLVLDNLGSPMVWVNQWTPLILAVFVAHTALNLFQFMLRHKGAEDEAEMA